MQLLNLENENSTEKLKEWIENLEKNKLTNIPNELMKEAAKDKKIKIKIGKNEQNKVLKN